MNTKSVATLITCHNRREKTIACLESLQRAEVPPAYRVDVYLTDDGSTDGTGNAVKELFPYVNLVEGDGNMFWAGGMRLAWKTALDRKKYDAFLLINDDVILHRNFIWNLLKAETYSLSETGMKGIYTGATVDGATGEVTYGGSTIIRNHLIVTMQKLALASYPQQCDLANANILWVSGYVVDRIGIFEERYTHGIADYDYSLRALKRNIPLWLAPGVCGICEHNRGKNWKTGVSLKERIRWMKSPKGLAYSEYLFYIKKHFPAYLPYSFIMMWMKILFPFVWDRFKKTA